jgi:hypothetical protein
MERGRQRYYQVDAALMPDLRRQRGCVSSSMRWPAISATSCERWRCREERWSLTNLRDKLLKIDAKVVSHGRGITFQMAEVPVSWQMLAEIFLLIARLRAPSAPP